MPVIPMSELPGSGLCCFKDKERMCTAECMAYVNPPAAEEFKDQQWAHCLELINLHRIGKHVTLLAIGQQEILKIKRNEATDRARTNQPAPPVPK